MHNTDMSQIVSLGMRKMVNNSKNGCAYSMEVRVWEYFYESSAYVSMLYRGRVDYICVLILVVKVAVVCMVAFLRLVDLALTRPRTSPAWSRAIKVIGETSEVLVKIVESPRISNPL